MAVGNTRGFSFGCNSTAEEIENLVKEIEKKSLRKKFKQVKVNGDGIKGVEYVRFFS